MIDNLSTEIPKTYSPTTIEAKWYKFWLDQNYFHADEKSENPSYSIVIPPPNITGKLHTGHALDNTLQDTLIRWRRMQGRNVLWMPGTDHAGIVTELIMERKLASEGTSRQELGRSKFIDRMWQWKHESRGTIMEQLQQLGCSCDWKRERFTLDDGLLKAVRMAFVQLYKKGLIYRGDYMVNWCPNCQTAVSDLEVEPIELEGNFYHIKYPIKDSEEYLEIATTRPETMLGDTAIAVNPNDVRYKKFVNKRSILPIIGRELPIIADEHVDLETGTGALKVTPAHDLHDYEIGIRHNLERINILNIDGTMNENSGEKFVNKDRFECREALVEELKELGLLVKIVPHRHAVGHHDRCGKIVEPYISPQWYVDVKPLAERSIVAVKNDDVKFFPERETKRFLRWMEEIRPWAISRQRWWGHQIPIWHCDDCGKITCELEDPNLCGHCRSTEISQDEDVLDTWFSSGLWPFSTMGWPNDTPDLLETFYPTSVLVTGWDILFFWVSRMIMLGLECTDSVPFKHVYLHGLVADEQGQKMSKSRGNTIDPIEIIKEFGADSFRFAIVHCTVPSPYMPLPEHQIEAGRRFANKIWNASRFLLMNLEDFDPDSEIEINLTLADRWIRSRFNATVQAVNSALEKFRFSDVAHLLYDFIWHQFCDWYIEMIKIRFYHQNDTIEKYTAQKVAIEILDGSLRLLHPIMPFITEELWQRLPVHGESITIASYPKFDEKLDDISAENVMSIVTKLIGGIRSVLGEMNISPSREVELLVQVKSSSTKEILERHLSEYLSSFLKFSRLSIAEHQEKPRASATAVIDDVTVFIPLEGLMDFEKEKLRLQKKLEKVKVDREKVEKSLNNPNFIDRAPAEVVDRKRRQLARLSSEEEKLLETWQIYEFTD